MAVYKEEKTNTWRVIYRYTDWTGEKKQTQKRGFKMPAWHFDFTSPQVPNLGTCGWWWTFSPSPLWRLLQVDILST